MAYDEDLAERVRELLADESDVTERRMFGGLAFLLDGKMALAVGQSDVLVRVEPAEAERLIAAGRAEPAIMGARRMRGWVEVDADRVRTKRQLAGWVRRGAARARA